MKKRFFAFVCFACASFAAFSQSAQQWRLDSLRKSLANLHDTARVNCLNQLSSLHWSMSHVSRKDSMYYYARLANQQAVKIGYEYGKAISLILLAKYELFAVGNAAGADDYIDQSVRIGETIKNNSLLGMANLLRCDLPAETRGGMSYFDCLKKSQSYFQKAGDGEGELEATTWLCMLFADEGKYEEGFAYCEKCLQLSKSITPQHSNWHHELVQWAFLNMASLYETAGDYETSMRYIQQCDQYARTNDLKWDMDILKSRMFRKTGKYDSSLFYWNEWEKGWNSYAAAHQAFGNTILAEIYFSKEQYDEALKLLESSITTYRKEKKNRRLPDALFAIAKIHVQKKNWNNALKYAHDGFVLAKKENIQLSVVEGHELLSQIFHARGKNDKAFKHLQEHIILKDSVLSRQFLWRMNNYKKAADDEKKKASIDLLSKDNQIKDQRLKQENLVKKCLIAALGVLMFITVFIFRTLRLKQKYEKLQRERLENDLTVQKLQSEKQQAELRQQAAELEMQALRSQMNPHFIFNCLSSINRFILKNEPEAASDYLIRFSRLVRLVLGNSKKSLITLESELEMLRLYLEMERLRFKDAFGFNISFRSKIDTSEIFIPPLVFQPFAENAIWHGLMNKEGDRQLDISFTLEGSILTCTITDNGVGRRKAEIFKSKADAQRKSMGLQITTERLAKLNMEHSHDTFFKIEDLYDDQGHACGTKVILKIRMQYTNSQVVDGQISYA